MRGTAVGAKERPGGSVILPKVIKKAIGSLVRAVSALIPKKDLMLFSSADAYAGNARACYEAVVRDGFVAETMWLSLGPKQHRSFDAYSIPHVPLASLRGMWLIVRARWLVSTHGEMGRFRAARGQTYVNLWHGLPFKNGGYLWSEAEGDELADSIQRCDVMLSSSPFTKSILASVFHVKASKLVPTGIPRNDPLVDFDSSRERLNRLLPDTEFDRVVLYCPTHRKDLGGPEESSWTFDTFRNEYLVDELSEALARHRIQLMIKLHPFDELRAEGEEWELPDNVRILTNAQLVEQRVELYDVLGGFDAFWSDYSSMSVDFLLTGRPIFYIVDDLDEYLEGRGVVLDDFAFLAPGPHVRGLDDLLPAIEQWVADPDYYSAERQEATRRMHTAPAPFSENLVAVLKEGA